MSSPEEPATPIETSPEATAKPPVFLRRRVLVAAAAVVVAAGVVTILVWPKSAASHPIAAPPTTPAATTSAPVTPTPTETPTPTPTVTPVPHEVVDSSAPTSFTFTGKGVDIKAHVCGMLNIRPLDPPGEQHHTVCWVKEGFGVAPSTTSATTYILGHAWGQDDREVLNQLSARAMTQVLKVNPVWTDGVRTYPVTNLNGDKITLKTGKGTLIYTVRDAYAVSKSQAGFIKSLMNEHIAKRVVIITCGELHHHDYDYNIIVDAYLTASVGTSAA